MGSILVTGALGNVGGYVAQSLIDRGETPVLADIDARALQARYGDRGRATRFDFTDGRTFEAALDGVDRVFLMRPPHLGKPEDLRPFVEALRAKTGIRLVSFLSLIGVEHNPVPPHHRIEKDIERAGLPFCHIRPSFFMQNIGGVHAFEIRHFDRIVVPVGRARTSLIDARDVGELTAHVLLEPERHRDRAYAITGPEALDYDAIARILSEALGRDIAYAHTAPALARRYWIDVRGLDRSYATVMGMLYLMTRMGAAKKVTRGFQDVMGREPRSFQQFVRDNLAAWQREERP